MGSVTAAPGHGAASGVHEAAGWWSRDDGLEVIVAIVAPGEASIKSGKGHPLPSQDFPS